MNHDEVVERLPWYLAGSLEPAERAAVARHLESCPACREELAATRAAARLFAVEHPAPATLAAAAWGRFDVESAAAIEAHVAECADCREELALLAASRGLEEEGAGERGPRGLRPAPATRPAVRWPLALAAASAVACAALALLAALRMGTAEDAAAELRAELIRARMAITVGQAATGATAARGAALERQLAELTAPRAGVPWIELHPEGVLRGGAAAAATEIDRGAGPFVLLVVALERPRASAAWGARLLDGAGGERFSVAPAAADASGALTLLVPTAALPAGAATLVIAGAGGETAELRYGLRVRGDPPSQPTITNEAHE